MLRQQCQAGNTKSCGQFGRLLTVQAQSEAELAQGVVLLEAACGATDADACGTLGEYYAKEHAPGRAADLLSFACNKGTATACTALGDLRARATAVDPDAVRATFRRACRLGDGRGCERLGMALWRDDFSGNRGDALAAFAAGCEKEVQSSCHTLAIAKLRIPTQRDAGIALLRQNCERRIAESCAVAASLWAPVLNQEVACERAVPFAESGCREGNADACAISIACRLEQDNQNGTALNEFERRCTKKQPLACLYWANAQEKKIAALTDTQRLYAAYKTACQSQSMGNILACVRLVGMELKSIEFATEAEPQLTFLRDACNRDSAEACCRLAGEYELGKHISADSSKATELRRRACMGGMKSCCPKDEARSQAVPE